MYSHHKTHMTWKTLIGITPNGVASFLSHLWAGSISDTPIVPTSGLLDLCEKGDAVMGDKGVLISDLTTNKRNITYHSTKENEHEADVYRRSDQD